MKTYVLILFPMLLTSCLTMIPTLTDEEIEFNQKPDGVRVQILRSGELVAEVVTPGRITLRRGVPYVYRFTKPGYQTVTVFPPPKTNRKRELTSCIAGVVTARLGYFVDMWSGVLNEADTEELEIELVPEGAGAAIAIHVSFSDRDGMVTLQAR